MSIILTTQPNLSDENTLNILGDFGKAIGVPGFPQPNEARSSAFTEVQALNDDINNVINRLTGNSDQEVFDPNYVGDGKQSVPGGFIQGGKVTPLEEANIRRIYSQSPQISVIIKKRIFSSLYHLYDPSLMDPAEKWLLRAIKRLTSAKCEMMASYERLSKIQRLEDLGAKPGVILASLITTLAEEGFGDRSAFTSAMELQVAQSNRQPPEITTYHIDERLPIIEELGPGSGTFEITAVSGLNTRLGLDGSGSGSFEIEDPYRLLIVTELDIENALRDTALSRFVDVISNAAGLALTTAQTNDSILQKTRAENNKSEITFSVGVGSNAGVSAVIDAIGFEITEDNINEVPEPHNLSSDEQTLFSTTLSALKNYEFAMRKNILSGLGGVKSAELREQVQYARSKMRLFHLGKAIIQPMDEVHILIDGGTRRLGETGDIEDPNEKFNMSEITGASNVIGNILGLQNEAQIDDDLLEIEWRREGQHMRFKDFKKLRVLQGSGETGTHVFAGLVKRVQDKYDANSGKFTLSVTCDSNMEWLRLSRFNQQPSLDQTQGIIYDPLTPFKINTDPATGLPIGKPELLDVNQKILAGELDKPKVYFSTGSKTGKQARTLSDMEQDVRNVGGTLVQLYQHAPGLVYRWKPDIMTVIYNLHTVNPEDGTVVNANQLRREVGFFGSNTPFDNMDAANIISLLVTGFPYDAVRFVQSAINNSSFTVDNTYNDLRHYFHTFMDVQRSTNFVQGNFNPFKTLSVSPKTFADAINLQRQISQKSSRLSQLRTQSATLDDKITTISKARGSKEIATALKNKKLILDKEIKSLSEKIQNISLEDNKWLEDGVLSVAGNDITFDLLGGDKEFKIFGDRLTHASLRRREDIIRNNDKNYLIISDEYDKDYDIQAFVLKMREQSPHMWNSTWQSVLEICKNVAEILNFEFFCSTQGHIVFRPPQYNKTPSSILSSIFATERASGVSIIPEFLRKLIGTREKVLIDDLINIEWEVILNGALLGKSTILDVELMVSNTTGNNESFIVNAENQSALKVAIQGSEPMNLDNRIVLQDLIRSSNFNTQLQSAKIGGVFTANVQASLQKDILNEVSSNILSIEDIVSTGETLYNEARNALTRLRGTRKSSMPEFDKAKVGALKNGQRTVSSDTARTISNIADLMSRRSRILLLLEKVIQQNVEFSRLDESGNLKVSPQGFMNENFNKFASLYPQLIEDDSKNTLGHLSGERFVIKDEHIRSSSFEEVPPDITVAKVTGTEPIVGEGGGNLASIPMYLAYGVDFDLWRQYGWRDEKPFDKPFFWNAELQCAPYAVMLLSRQRRDIVKGSVTVFGNEYYQLGDVVYITHRNMLYYVNSISHSFSYGGDFSTTLDLRYGHAPGDYIPTPLDIIGKGLVTRGRSHGAYRMRRERPVSDTLLGIIEFPKSGNVTEMLKGSRARRNFNQLRNAALSAKQDIDVLDPSNSSKVFILSFGGNESIQNQRANVIKNWFVSPYSESSPKGGSGINGLGDFVDTDNVSTIDKEIFKYSLPESILVVDRVDQTKNTTNLTPSEKELLRSGIIADQKTIGMDNTLSSVIEIRLRQPPSGGWK
jgi:hypothetical protein